MLGDERAAAQLGVCRGRSDDERAPLEPDPAQLVEGAEVEVSARIGDAGRPFDGASVPPAIGRQPPSVSRAYAAGSERGVTATGSPRSSSAPVSTRGGRPVASGSASVAAGRPAARQIASTIRPYPVDRQRLPEIASRIAASVGAVPGATEPPGPRNRRVPPNPGMRDPP